MKYVLLVLVMLGGSAYAAASKKSFGQRVVDGAKDVKDRVVGFFGKGHGPSQPVKTLWQKGADASLAEAGASGSVRRETFDSDVVRADEASQSMFVPQEPRQPTQQSNYGFPRRATSPYHGSPEPVYVPRSGDSVATQPVVPGTMIVRSEPVVQQASFSKAKSIPEQLAIMRTSRVRRENQRRMAENSQMQGVAKVEDVEFLQSNINEAFADARGQRDAIVNQLKIGSHSAGERKSLNQELARIDGEIKALEERQARLQDPGYLASLNKPDSSLVRAGEVILRRGPAAKSYSQRQTVLREAARVQYGPAKSPVGYLKDSLKTARTSAAEIVQRIKALRLRPSNGRRSASSPVAQQAE
jgi:hypothetical protein